MNRTIVAAGMAVIALAAADLGGAGGQAQVTTAYDFTFTAIDGKPLPLSQFKGKAVLVVNTASQCGFTPQYKGLQALYDKYRERGLVVLGVPSNDFGGQEPGASGQIKEFCESFFGITFPLTDKQAVKGNEAHPFYKWAAQQLGPVSVPQWNFHKYLIAPNGRLADWFASPVTPDSDVMTKAIEAALPAK